jgi:hypothetical protein
VFTRNNEDLWLHLDDISSLSRTMIPNHKFGRKVYNTVEYTIPTRETAGNHGKP